MANHAFSIHSNEELTLEFNTNLEQGLSYAQVETTRARFGRNELTRETHSAFSILVAQFRSPFIYLLFAASALAFFLGETIDSALILLFILINTGLGFYQEFHSEQTLRLLRKYHGAHARCVRDGHEHEIAVEELVPGDVVILETGDRIPADIIVLDAHALSVDESVLTGESVPVVKEAHMPTGTGGAQNEGFSGTMIVHGSARALVVATGNASSIGTIGTLGADAHHPSSFERSIARFSAFIIRLVVATLGLVFLAHLLISGTDTDIPNLLLFAIALAVGVIPEALPVVTTFSLSRGALALAKRHVVVRRLSAVEDLGSIEILCTDKTGTITENKLTVAHVYGDRDVVVTGANLGAEEDTDRTEPFDIALWNALDAHGQEVLTETPITASASFDPHTRRNAVIRAANGVRTLYVRGAPEALLSLCSSTSATRETLLAWCASEGALGHRVLAVATRILADHEDAHFVVESPDKLTLLGMVTFTDPVKESTRDAIEHARALGLSIKILTGDSVEVAAAVGMEIGLIHDHRAVLSGEQFAALSSHEKHASALSASVFARVTPEQKYEIIELLQEQAEVGFLGEGINDVPALRAAGVSLVVDSASDIARDVADIVLLDKSLDVIVDGIRAGRIAVANTSKYIKATLASSFGNFYAVAIVSLFVDFLPMLPLQLLLLNLLSDFPMIAIAADTVDASETSRPNMQSTRDILLVATVLGIVSTFFDFLFFGLFMNSGASTLQTNWFIGSALTELVFLFSIRSRLPFYKAKRPPTFILLLTLSAFAATICIPFVPFFANIFRFTPPSFAHLGLILGIVAVYFVSSESVKLLYYRLIANTSARVS